MGKASPTWLTETSAAPPGRDAPGLIQRKPPAPPLAAGGSLDSPLAGGSAMSVVVGRHHGALPGEAELAASGTQPWARLWQQGHGRAWGADTDYITTREGTWRRALLELPASSDADDDRTCHCRRPWTVTKWLTISETNAAITSHLPEPSQVTS
jgi:hypothetical protein